MDADITNQYRDNFDRNNLLMYGIFFIKRVKKYLIIIITNNSECTILNFDSKILF